MFRAVSVQNFRCFNQFKIETPFRVNLITGKNDVGKTTLLEAIYLLLGEWNAGLVTKIHAFRGLEKFQGSITEMGDWFWSSLFRDANQHREIEIVGEEEIGKRTLKIRVFPPSSTQILFTGSGENVSEPTGIAGSNTALSFDYTDAKGNNHVSNLSVHEGGLQTDSIPPAVSMPGYFMTSRRAPEEDANLLGQILVRKDNYDIVSTLKIIESRLTKISPLPSPSGTILYGDVGLSQMFPLSVMGDGLSRLTAIVLRLVSARNGVVLIDEIGDGLHYSILTKVWEAIAQTAEDSQVQVFATTHSWECIRAAHAAYSSRPEYDFRLHRLERRNGAIEAVTYEQEQLDVAIETGLEVR